ncbi:MAG TPA: ATP-binding protein, partial [Bacteroidales bacterium]|nr:ATP-binding protein [Bacteroidales bacterium]
MINKFISFIKQNGLPQPTDNCTIVLAISGGIDSVVMLDLFNEAGYKFVIAHANFQLRGNDSDLDQFFVQKLSQKYNTIFFTKKFDTINYAKQNHLSIQMAAREL